jgi:AcrR family transcriptional regulator
MRDKTEQILQAAVKVFIKKGFQASTQEIAEEAEVAEITLFRKFSTKQNLFITVIKNVLEKQFSSKIMKLAEQEDTEEFFVKIMDDRLNMLSKNVSLVRMLISESLKGNLTDEINFPVIIQAHLKKALDHHFDLNKRMVDTALCVRQLAGIFLSHIIIPHDEPYFKLSNEAKEILLNKYMRSLMVLLD